MRIKKKRLEWHHIIKYKVKLAKYLLMSHYLSLDLMVQSVLLHHFRFDTFPLQKRTHRMRLILKFEWLSRALNQLNLLRVINRFKGTGFGLQGTYLVIKLKDIVSSIVDH